MKVVKNNAVLEISTGKRHQRANMGEQMEGFAAFPDGSVKISNFFDLCAIATT